MPDVVTEVKRRKFEDFKVGEKLEATVTSWARDDGYLVDVGAVRPAHLELCELSDGLPSSRYMSKETKVNVRVLDYDRAANRLYVTRRTGGLGRPPRTKLQTKADKDDFEGIRGDATFEGMIVHVSSFGVWVRIMPPGGVFPKPVDGLLHKSNIDFDVEASHNFVRGGRVRVWVEKVAKGKLYLTMFED